MTADGQDLGREMLDRVLLEIHKALVDLAKSERDTGRIAWHIECDLSASASLP